MATHYKLSSAMKVGDRIRPAGTIVPADDVESMASFAMLVEDAHLVECDAPETAPVKPVSPFPKRRAKAEPSEGSEG